MGFGVVVPVVGGGVTERERESVRKSCIIYIILICTMVK